jgi:uncharacterized membrane protein (UPF0127 family)
MKKVLIVTLILLMVSIVFYNLTPTLSWPGEGDRHKIQKTIPIIINNQTFTVVVADTPKKQIQGLSGTLTLPHDGMLFVFDTPGKPSFWMKDMHYSLDFIWLDADKKVVDTSENISPQTFPNTISPNTDSKYVLETKAGFAKEYDVKVG